MDRDQLRIRYEQTRTRIAAAASRYGRAPESIGLVAISKQQPVEAIRALAELGQRDFGENYLQEALPKLRALRDLPLTWHFTGRLQSNKTRPVAENFAWVHTLDRDRIAARLNEQRPPHASALNVCIQIRLGEEPPKGGIAPEEAFALAEHIEKLPRLKLRGLMCIAPAASAFEEQRAWLAQLARCRDELAARGLELDTLSMGMSDDLDAAISCGATWVRIGTALFGPRSKKEAVSG